MQELVAFQSRTQRDRREESQEPDVPPSQSAASEKEDFQGAPKGTSTHEQSSLPLVSLTHRSRHSSTLYHQSRLAQVLHLRFAGARNPILVLCVEMTEKASIDDVIVNVTEIEIRTKTVISIVNDRANA